MNIKNQCSTVVEHFFYDQKVTGLNPAPGAGLSLTVVAGSTDFPFK